VMAETDRWESTGFGVGKSGAADFDLSRDLQVYSAALELEAYPRFGPGLVLGAAYHGQDRAGSGLSSDYSLLVGAYRDLVADTRLRASWARKVRFPSIRQLYDVTAGNLDLAAETTLHYEVGVERRLGARGAASVAAFQTDARDFIEKDGSGFYQNYEKYLFRGVEVAAEGRAVPALFLRGSYAYLHSEDQTGGGGREDLQYRPRHKLGGEASYRFAFGLMPYLSLVRVAGQYTYDNDDKEPLQKRKLGDYTLVDARLRQDLLGGQVQVNVGVDNLLDADYEQSYGLPQSGRTLYGGVRYPF
ncbi:MAG: TonB-dependent receptor, partial [Gemmatimonadota bacterium]